MRPKTFSEKWDREEREMEKDGFSGVTTKKRKGVPVHWKKYLKRIVIVIIILIIILVIVRIVL